MIKVDGAGNPEQVSRLRALGVDLVTCSVQSWAEWPSYLEGSSRGIQQIGFGVHFDPHQHLHQDVTRMLDTPAVSYVQIDYSQLEHASSVRLRDEYRGQKRFFCDNVFADSDSDPGWVADQVRDAAAWGCELCVINLFFDLEMGWERCGTDEFEYGRDDLIKLAKSFRIGISSDFSTQDVRDICLQLGDSVILNLSLGKSMQFKKPLTLFELSQLISAYRDQVSTQRKST